MRLEWHVLDLAAMASDLTAAERAEVLEQLEAKLAGMRSYAAALELRVAKQRGDTHAWDIRNLDLKRGEIAIAEEQLWLLQQADAAAGRLAPPVPPSSTTTPSPPGAEAERSEAAGAAGAAGTLPLLWLDCMYAANVLVRNIGAVGGVAFCVTAPHVVHVRLSGRDSDVFWHVLEGRYEQRTGLHGEPPLEIKKHATENEVYNLMQPAEHLDAFYEAFGHFVAQQRVGDPDGDLHGSVAAPGVTYERLRAVNDARREDERDWSLHLIVDGDTKSNKQHAFGHSLTGLIINRHWMALVKKMDPRSWSDAVPLNIREGAWPRVTKVHAQAEMWLACLQVADELGLAAADCYYLVYDARTVLINVPGTRSAFADALQRRMPDVKVEYVPTLHFTPKEHLDSFAAGLNLFLDDLRRTKPEHAALLGMDGVSPALTYKNLTAPGWVKPEDKQLCLWTPGEQIDFTSTNSLHPWAAAPPSKIVEHVVAMWHQMLKRIFSDELHVFDDAGRPIVMRGPSQDERWRVFTGTTFSMRQRAAIIDAVEERYNALDLADDDDVDPWLFRREVLQRPAWLPGVGSVLYHGTREESFLGDPNVLQRMRTVTFFSPDAPMSQTYAAHNMLAFRVAHELPEPMVHIQHIGGDQLTHDKLAAVWTPLFGYPKSFFTRAAEIVAKLWGTGMVVTQAQSFGALTGRQPTGVEVVLCEPQRYLEQAPVTMHLRQDLFNGQRLAYPNKLGQYVEFTLYKTFVNLEYWSRPLGVGARAANATARAAAFMLEVFQPAAVTSWADISDHTTCLFDDAHVYSAQTHGTATDDAGRLGYALLSRFNAASMPPPDALVFVHDVQAMDAAVRRFLQPVLSLQAVHGDDVYQQTIRRNVQMNTTTLLFAERQYPRLLRLMRWARNMVTPGNTGFVDVVRVNNRLAYYWMPQAPPTPSEPPPAW